MSVARKVSAGFGGSYTDLTEWNSGTSRLMFADNHGIGFGAGNDMDFYSNGTVGCRSVPSQGLALDSARLVDQFSSFTVVASLASAPYTVQNAGHSTLPGIAATNNTLYLVGASGAPGLAFASTAAPNSPARINWTISTSTLALSAPSANSIQVGDSGDKVAICGATPVVRAAHIVDADGTLADVTTKFNTLLARCENVGINLAS